MPRTVDSANLTLRIGWTAAAARLERHLDEIRYPILDRREVRTVAGQRLLVVVFRTLTDRRAAVSELFGNGLGNYTIVAYLEEESPRRCHLRLLQGGGPGRFLSLGTHRLFLNRVLKAFARSRPPTP